MKYRVIERELKNGTKEYVLQFKLWIGVFLWEDYRVFFKKKEAIAKRDQLNGYQIKSEKEIK